MFLKIRNIKVENKRSDEVYFRGGGAAGGL